MAACSSLQTACRRAAESFEALLACDACEVVVEAHGQYVCKAGSSFDTGTRPIEPSIRRNLTERVREARSLVRVSDTAESEQFGFDVDYRSLLAVPLGGHGSALLFAEEAAAFDESDEALADVFAGHVTQVIREVDSSKTPESQTRATKHLDAAEVMIVVLDATGRIRYANRKARDVLGYGDGDLFGRDWFETCVPEAERSDVAEVFDKLLQGSVDPVEWFENPVVTNGGDERIIEWHNTLLRDESGEITGTLSSGLDVTAPNGREGNLEAAQRQYRTLLQAAPDPVFVADAETREILETNAAAAEFRGQPREDIVGLSLTDLCPDADAYCDFFETGTENAVTRRSLANGDPVYAVTASGERIPVEVSITTVEINGSSVIYGIFRDISDRLVYERTLTGLNEAMRELFEGQTQSEVATRIVETVTDVLDLPGAGVYLLDETDGVLHSAAYSSQSDVGEIDRSTFEPGGSIVWNVFTRGEPEACTGSGTDEVLCEPETPFRNVRIVPLGEYGVLVVGDTEVDTFDRRTGDIVEILGATAEAALDHAEQERDLKTREKQLRRQTSRLERVESINARIRDVARAIVRSTTRREIEQAVCAQLVESDSLAFAWVGTVDPITDSLTVRAKAGTDRGYLDRVRLSTADESVTEPAVRTARTLEPAVVENTAKDIAREAWRSEAAQQGFQSVMSIPLVYQETLRGVLTVYSPDRSTFSRRLQSVLSELGELTAHGLVAAERKQALLSNATTELEFDIQDRGCFFLWFTQDTNCSLELERIIPQSDETSLVFVEVLEGSSTDMIEAAERSSSVESTRLVRSDDRDLIQLRIVEPFIASILADHGITVRNISADSSECRVTVAVPPTASVHQVVDVISNTYTDSEVLAKRERSRYSRSPGAYIDQVLEDLTPRQREVVEIAYFSGYFDSPREVNGEELASRLDFSASAFHHHIRAAERKLFSTIFESNSPDLGE